MPGRQRASVLRDREFQGLWAAQTLSRLGDQLARVALTVLAFQLTGSAFAAGAAYAVTMVPWLIGGPLLGWIGDRYPRRAVLISCDLGSAALLALMALPVLPLPALYVALFVSTLLGVPFSASRSALVRDIFPDDARYASATALGAVTGQFAQVAGFAAGGVLAAATTPRQALLIDAATFALSAVVVRRRVAARSAVGGSTPHDGRRRPFAGVRLVFGDPRLRRLTFYAWLATFHTVPAGVVAPYVAGLGGGARTVGFLLACTALGTALSMIVVSRWVPDRARQRLLEPLAVLAGVPLILCVVAPGLPLTGLLWGLSGAGTGYQLAANVAFVSAVPGASRAEAFALVSSGLVAGQGAGVLLAGALAVSVPSHLVVAGSGLLATAAALVLWRATPRTRTATAVSSGTARRSSTGT